MNPNAPTMLGMNPNAPTMLGMDPNATGFYDFEFIPREERMKREEQG